MRVTRIYYQDGLNDQESLTLSGQSGQHVARVLRMRAGDELILFDGLGGEHRASIESVQGGKVELNLLGHNHIEREAPVPVTLIQGVSRGERMDWTIQKATELGVHRIVPVTSLRSMVKLKGDRAERRRGHWQQVAISACEQCGRNRVPQISDPVSLEDGLAQVEAFALKLTLRADATMRIAQLPESPPEACIAIGPEGGFDDREYQLLEQAGFQGLRLGPRILRTETAGLAAMAALLSRWGDF
mgnify:CR=1 FL=1|jgi:16S rRNA (uracil1498-N3)-methyltransferase